MYQMPGGTGKAASSTAGGSGKAASQPSTSGKTNATSSGSSGKFGSSTGASTGSGGASQTPGLLSLVNGLINGGGVGSNPVANPISGGINSPGIGTVGTATTPPTAPSMTTPQAPIGRVGLPIVGRRPESPTAQGYQGASASQQNPNEGGASTSPSAYTNPGQLRGGMDIPL